MDHVMPDQPPSKQKKPFKRYVWWAGLSIVAMLLALTLALYLAIHSARGTQYFLTLIERLVPALQYEHVSGTLGSGLKISQLRISTKKMVIEVDKATLTVNADSILRSGIHLYDVQIGTLLLRKLTPPDHEPFSYTPISLPIALRVDRLQLAHFIYRVPTQHDFTFEHATLKQATFRGHQLSLNQATFFSRYFSVHNATGTMVFSHKYPVQLLGDLAVNALEKKGLEPFHLKLAGSLAELIVDATVNWPKPATAHAILQPVEQHVPLRGHIEWKSFDLPFAKQEKIVLEQGRIEVSGLAVQGLNLHLDSQISGKHIPAGRYRGDVFSDYKKLDINKLTADILGGQVQAAGQLQWLPKLDWALTGSTSAINVNNYVPKAAHPYVPQKITAQWHSLGKFEQTGFNIQTLLSNVSGDAIAKRIDITVNQVQPTMPLQITTNWQGLQYQLAQLAQLQSPKGKLVIAQQQGRTRLDADYELTAVTRPQDMLLKLPAGHYQLNSAMDAQDIHINELNYQGAAGYIALDAIIKRLSNKMVWDANIARVQLNEFFISRKLPLQSLAGNMRIHGVMDNTTQQIDIQQADVSMDVALGTQPALGINYHGTGQVVFIKAQTPVLHILANGDVSSNRFSGPLELSASHQENTWELQHLRSLQQNNGVQLTGTFTNDPQRTQFSARGTLTGFDPAIVNPKLRGSLSGNLDVAGQMTPAMLMLHANDININGQINQQPVMVQGGLDWQLARRGVWSQRLAQLLQTEESSVAPAQQLIASWGGNRANVQSGGAGIAGQITLPDLSQFSGLLGGALQGDIHSSQYEQGALDIHASVEQLHYGNQFIADHISLTGQALPQAQIQGTWQLEANQIQYGKYQLDALKASVSGNLQQHQLELTATKKNNVLNVGLDGGLSTSSHWLGKMMQGKLQALGDQLALSQAVPLDVDIKNRLLLMHAHCWRGDSSVCFTRDLHVGAVQGDIGVTIDRFNLANLNTMIPEQFSFEGLLTGTGDVRWQKGSILRVHTDLQTNQGHIGILPDSESTEPVQFAYDQLKLKVNALDDRLQVRFDMKTPQMGTGYIDAQIDPNATPKHIQGALVLDNVLLSIMRPFIPELRAVEGTASLAGGMAGPLFAPQFFGEFRLDEGAVQVNNLPVNLNHINMTSSIRGTQATYQGSFMSGEGTGQVTGQAQWQNNPSIQLKLTGERLLVKQPPLLKAEINPTVELSLMPRTREGSLQGTIIIPSMVVSPASTGTNAIKQSPDAVVIDQRVMQKKPTVAKAPWKLRTNLSLVLGNEVLFQGFGAHAKLEGDLAITQKQAEGFVGIGRISTVRSESIRAFGQVMELKPQSGVIFSGKLSQPDLSIEAFKTIDGHELGVSIFGNPLKPTVVMVNDAGLNEQETINALLSGRIPDDSATIDNTSNQNQGFNNTLAAAGISLGLSGTSQLTGQIGRKFGLSDLTIDADSADDDTHLNVTGYITPDLFVRYGRSIFDSDNIIAKWTLRYQVNRKLYLEASSSIDKAIDAFYSWRF